MGLTNEENPTQDRCAAAVVPSGDPVDPVDLALLSGQLEEALRDERQRSERLGRELRATRERARRMDDLISTICHDLRSPLGSIQLNLQSILQAQRALPRWIRARVLRAEELLRHTAQLINDILVIERARHGGAVCAGEETDLAAFVRQTVGLLSEQIAAAHSSVSIRCDTPAGTTIVGRWERIYLAQVVSNLVTNAIKYGAGKPFEITLVHRGDHAQITFQDHGIGVDERDQQRIFERFEQLERDGATTGVGLGLWIVTEAVQQLQGTIHLHSTPGEGSTFIVELPVVA